MRQWPWCKLVPLQKVQIAPGELHLCEQIAGCIDPPVYLPEPLLRLLDSQAADWCRLCCYSALLLRFKSAMMFIGDPRT